MEKAKEEAYFFKLSKYQDKLIDLLTNTNFLEPETRRNEMLGFIKQGLDDLCISRSTFDWGIPVPIDEKHVIYVWLDALTNYITALGYPDEPELFEKYLRIKVAKIEEVPDSRVLMHCYSSSKEMACQYVKLGATLSIAGPVTFKNNRKTIEVVEEIPIEFLLVETDSPYLTPEPFRGKKNKSPYVEYVARRVAVLKGMDYEEVARITCDNAKNFYGILR